MKELRLNVEVMFRAFRVSYKVLDILKAHAFIAIVPDFGVVVCGFNTMDFVSVRSLVELKYHGYRAVYITNSEEFLPKKEEVLWELMRSGYMTYLRSAYPRQFNEMIMHNGLGNRIIDKRLALWADQPKYHFLIEENKAAKNEANTYILTINPGFYDYMPEDPSVIKGDKNV